MRAIFISYRRNDAEGEAGRLFDDLVNRFGEASAFMDVAAIQKGRDFRKAIDESIATCGVLLAIIGKNWVDAKNQIGTSRLEDPLDFVRLEIASALKRDVPVIPVLVHGASMPRPDELPDDLKDLAFRNGCELTHARWNSDLELLIHDLRAYVDLNKPPVPVPIGSGPAPIPATPRGPSWKSRAAILAIVVAVAAIAFAAYRLLTPTPKPQVAASAPLTKAPVSVPTTTNSTAAVPPVAAPAPKNPQPAIVEIPLLTGMSISAAVQALRAQHLALGSISKQLEPDAPSNTVIDEFPKSGQKVDAATAVDLVVAEPPKREPMEDQPAKVEIPSLTGMSLEAAEQTLRSQHLAPGSISREPKSDAAPNTVVDQFPKAGRKVDAASGVDLLLAEPSALIGQPVPNPVPSPAVSSAPAAKQVPLPDFSGTWQEFEYVRDGVTTPVHTAKPLTITQNGAVVTRSDNGFHFQITPAGIATRQAFLASDGTQARIIESVTFRLEGAILVRELTKHYIVQVGDHPPGTTVLIDKYRRISPGSGASTAPAGSSK